MKIAALAPYLPAVYYGTGVFAAAVVTEMAVRTLVDLGQILTGTGDDKKVRWNLSADLGGILFYGGLALNLIPGSRLVGAAFFAGYALFRNNYTGREEYFTAKIIRVPIQKVCNAVSNVLSFIWKYQHPTWYGSALILTAIWFKYGTNFAAIATDLKPKFI